MRPHAPSHKRLDFLDIARGAAALLVVLEHGFQHCVPGYMEFSRANIVIGQAGILVFFMISGFVIPLSLEVGMSNTTFWKRRFFRLFPVYWLSIGLASAYLLFGGPLPIGVELSDWGTWLTNLVLLQSVLNRPNVWGVFWSLHFEVALYIVFSLLLAFGLLHRIGARTFVALLAGIALAFSAKAVLFGGGSGNGDLRLVILAMLFGLIAQRYHAQRISRATFRGLFASVFATMLVVWTANHLMHPSVATYAQLLRWMIIAGLGFGSFVGLLAARDREMPRVACWLGRRSYPIYLVHPFVLLLLSSTSLSVWSFVPCLVGFTLVLAELVHRFVELPGIALGRRFERCPKIEERIETRRAA